MSRRLLLVLSLAATAVIGAAAVLVVFAHDFQPFGPAEKLAQVVTDAIWIAAGLIAWQRRPGNRVGPLMTAVGFLDVLQQLYWHAALPFTLAALAAFFFAPVVLHLFLAFPSGRLQTRFERAFVGSRTRPCRCLRCLRRWTGSPGRRAARIVPATCSS